MGFGKTFSTVMTPNERGDICEDDLQVKNH